MHPLSLHHLTALDASPAELVGYAAESDCRLVSLFTYMPPAIRRHYPVVERSAAAALAETMANAGVGCHCLEVFPLAADTDWDGITEGLQIGALLSASLATVHIQEPDPVAATDMLLRLASLADPLGIRLGVEFNPFSHCLSLADAIALVERVPAAGVGVMLDTLHAFRSSTSLAEIAAAAPHILTVQISDGPVEMAADACWQEAIGARLLPGEGAFPLTAMLRLVAQSVVIDVEVPRHRAPNHSSPAAQRCRAALLAASRYA